jgi:hypothetical protein
MTLFQSRADAPACRGNRRLKTQATDHLFKNRIFLAGRSELRDGLDAVALPEIGAVEPAQTSGPLPSKWALIRNWLFWRQPQVQMKCGGLAWHDLKEAAKRGGLMSREGLSQRKIAKHFGVKQQAISKVLLGHRWKHVTDT